MKYVLAPLAGFTDAPFRRLCHEGGADLTYTEMVSAAGLAHGSSPTRHLMETMPGEGAVACQLFGAHESDIACATREVEAFTSEHDPRAHRFVELNLNAGCPMKKVTREGAGAKLMEDPEKIYRLLKAMVENTSLPVTLKTRLGPHPRNTNIFEIADAAERAGAKGLIVHARYTSQMHGGEVCLAALAELVKRTRLPVTGNGSVADSATVLAMEKTGVRAVMIGRAALANPFIFGELKSGAAVGSERTSPSTLAMFQTHLRYLLDFRGQLVRRYPDDHIPSADGFASVKMHVHLFRYFNGRPGAAELRKRLNRVRTLAEISATLQSCIRGIMPSGALASDFSGKVSE